MSKKSRARAAARKTDKQPASRVPEQKGNNKTKILLIAAIATALVAALYIILVIALSNRGPAPDASLVAVKTNGLRELIFEMSDGTEVNAGAIPPNHEGVEIISAKLDGVESVGTTGATKRIRIVCSDDNNADYELVWNIPKFGSDCSLISAKINYKGYLIFTVKQDGVNKTVNQGLLMKLSTPENELTPSGASTYASDESLDLTNTTYVDIKVKGYGTVTLALDKNAAPKTVEAFLKLVSEGYYNGLTFNKILDEEKYGDSASYVLGGISSAAADTVLGEFSENGYEGNFLSHKRGTVSLYHKDGEPDGGTSEFFICTADNTELDGKYAAFGYVVSGMNIVEKIVELTGTFSETDGIKSSELEKYRAKQATIESVTLRAASI